MLCDTSRGDGETPRPQGETAQMGVDITIGRREVVALGILASVVTLALAEVMPSSVAVGIVGAIAAEYGYLRVRLPRELLSQRRLRPGESPEPTHR